MTHRRPSTQSNSCLTHKYVGTYYDEIVIVADNIEDVVKVANDINKVIILADNIDTINSVYDDILPHIEEIETVSDNIVGIIAVADALNDPDGLPKVIDNMDEILLADDNAALATQSAIDAADDAARAEAAANSIVSDRAQITQNTNDIVTLTATVTAVDAGQAAQDTRLTTLETTTTGLRTDVDNNSATVGGFDTRITTNTNNIATMRNDVDANDLELADHETRVTALETTVSAPGTGYDARINANRADIDTLRTDVNNNDTDIANLDTRVTAVEGYEITTALNSGLQGGDDLSATPSLALDISGTREKTTLAGTDVFIVEDATGGKHRVTRDNLLSGLSGSVTQYRGTVNPKSTDPAPITTLTVSGDPENATISQGTAPTTPAGSPNGYIYIILLDDADKAAGVTIRMGGTTGAATDFTVFDQDQLLWMGNQFQHLETGDAVISVFGRNGRVTAQAGDYSGSMVSITPTGNLTSANVQSGLVEHQTDIDGINTTVAGHTVTLTDHETRITDNEADITALTTRVTDTETDVTALTTRVGDNETDIAALQGRMTNAEDTIADHETRITTNETSITNLDGRVTSNTNSITNIINGTTTVGKATDANTLDTLDSTDFVQVALNNQNISGRKRFTNTDSIKIPSGGTAQRPTTPEFGDFRANNDTNLPEWYNGGSWIGLNVDKSFPYQLFATDTNASANSGYLGRTLAGEFTVSLPATGLRDGQFVVVGDYDGDAYANNITVETTDGSTINGLASPFIINADYATYTFSYIPSQLDWRIVNAVGESAPPSFVAGDAVYTNVPGEHRFDPKPGLTLISHQCDVYYNEGRLIENVDYTVDTIANQVRLFAAVGLDSDYVVVRVYNRTDLVSLDSYMTTSGADQVITSSKNFVANQTFSGTTFTQGARFIEDNTFEGDDTFNGTPVFTQGTLATKYLMNSGTQPSEAHSAARKDYVDGIEALVRADLVPKTRTINGHGLGSDVTLTAGDVNAPRVISWDSVTGVLNLGI